MGEKEAKPIFYGSATVGKKGQVVLPADLREDLDIEPGDKLIFFSGLREGKGFGATKPEELLELQKKLGKLKDRLSEEMEEHET